MSIGDLLRREVGMWVTADRLWEETPTGGQPPHQKEQLPCPAQCRRGHDMTMSGYFYLREQRWRCRACERESNQRYQAAHPGRKR